jgi:Flp pilus assembly protein TadD
MDDYDKSIDLNPNNSESLSARATLHFVAGCMDLAKNDARKALALTNKLAQPDFLLGRIYLINEDYSNALVHFDHAISKDSKDSFFWMFRGITKTLLRRFDEAVSDLDQAASLDPSSAEVVYNRSRAYFEDGKYAQAIADATDAQNCKIIYNDTNYILGCSMYHMRNFEGAVAALSKYLRKAPNDAQALRIRGLAQQQLNDHEYAEKDLRKARKLKPELFETEGSE